MDISLINSQSLLHLLSLAEKKEELLQILEQIDAEILRTLKGGAVEVIEIIASQPAIARPASKPAAIASAKTVKAAKRSRMSPEGRAKMAAMMKARWEARRAGKPAAAAKSKAKKKGGLTPEGRAKLAANMKARWAARKAAAVPAKTSKITKKTKASKKA